MADDATVKQLLLQVDATTELLRRNLDKADQAVATFQSSAQKRLDATDQGFAKLGSGLDNLRPAIDRANAQIGTIGAAAQRAQKQVEASTSLIRSTLLSTASALGGAFAVEKVATMADTYTRFTNALKIAGKEGSQLASTQDALFNIAQKYGAPLETLGQLYGRAAQSSKALGASDADLLKFTDAVAAGLKVQGGSVEEARGALLQLSQALGTGVVHAQDFNSVNEQLRPILQAAADASEKYRGSVAAIKNDVNNQKLTSQELFRLVLAGYGELEKKASTANLTIGASLQILNNALGRYIGQTDQSLSATARFAGGVKLLADNLDTIVPAITTIAVAYGTVKAGKVAFDLVTAAGDRALGGQEGLTAAILKGNAAWVDNAALVARSAVASREAATAEVTAAEAAVAALREQAAQLEANIALIGEQRAAAQQSQAAITEAQRIGFGTLGQGGATRTGSQIDAGRSLKAEIATKEALTATNAELAAAEATLATARVAETGAIEAEVVATEAATFGSKAAAAATALFAGSLDLLAGALPIIIVGAFVAAIIHLREEAAEAEAQVKAFGDRHKEAAALLRETAAAARAASSTIGQTGTSAVNATPGIVRFAGAVGEAAQKLRDLAEARRKDLLGQLQDAGNKAQLTINQATARIDGRRQSDDSVARFGYLPRSGSDVSADSADMAAIRTARSDLAALRKQYQTIRDQPLESRLTGSERNGGRDVEGDLARVTRDLAVARQAGIRSQIETLQAQQFELTQYKKYVKRGLSPQAAQEAASKDAADFKSAAEGKDARKDGAKADRAAATEKRQAAAAAKRDANDTRAYKAAERQAMDSIAESNAELTNSAAARAQIERDRVEADRVSKNQEIAEQGKAGHFKPAEVKHLQDLNDQAAKKKTDVIDLRQRQQAAADQLAVDEQTLSVKRDLLTDQSQLATTAAQRRDLELQLLALAKEEERKRIAAVLDPTSKATEGERKVAQVQSDTLDARYASKAAVVDNNTRSPLSAYGKSLQDAVGGAQQIRETLQGIEVKGIEQLESGLSTAVTSALHLHGIFGDIAGQLVDMAIKAALVRIGGSFFGLADGGKVPGYAAGGIPGYAVGGEPSLDSGRISGPGTGTSDSILALVGGRRLIRVANGESINTAASTKANWPIIDAMNKGRLPRFAGGGLVSPDLAIRTPTRGETAAVAAQRSKVDVTTRLEIEPSPMFDVRSRTIAQQTVGAAAQPIMSGATTQTMKKLRRQALPGGYG